MNWRTHRLVQELEDLFAQKKLTAKDFLRAWAEDRDASSDEQYGGAIEAAREQVPYAVRVELTGRNDGHIVQRLRKWSPEFGVPCPAVLRWLCQAWGGEKWFESVEGLDREVFIRELMSHRVFGLRFRFELSRSPWFLKYLPEEERWVVLESVLREFGHCTGWGWPAFAAAWDPARAKALVHELIREPHLAAGFLAGAWAHSGWKVFKTLGELKDVLLKAAMLAPYEATHNRLWIATMLGDRIKNPASFMDAEETADVWPNIEEEYQKELAPIGSALADTILAQACRSYEQAFLGETIQLSACSEHMVERIKGLPEKVERASQAAKVAQVLLDLPESEFSCALLSRVLDGLPTKELGYALRWMLVQSERWNRDRFLILRGKEPADNGMAYESTDYGEALVRQSWVFQAMRRGMEEWGWKFCTVEHRRNDRYPAEHRFAWDAQVKVESRLSVDVYTLQRGRTAYGDFIFDRTSPKTRSGEDTLPPQEVMIPPGFHPGEPVFQKGMLRIYRVGERLHLVEPVPHDQRKWG
ncbi:MAG: hypothetical protein WCV84_05915 [Patescibacteria group bacterium]